MRNRSGAAGRLMASLAFVVLAVLATGASGAALGKRNYEISTQRSVAVMNESGRKFDVLWINTFRRDGELEYRSNNEGAGYPHGGTANILSYVGHEFQVREMPSKKTGKCKGPNGECATGHFQVNDKEDQLVNVDSEFNVIHTDSRKRAKDQLEEVKKSCKAKFQGDDSFSSLSLDEIVEATAQCLTEQIEIKLGSQKEEVEFQSSLRQRMGVDLLPHACKDPKAKTSAEVYNVTWAYDPEPSKKRPTEYQLKMLHERPTSRIATINHFLTPQECRVIKKQIELKKSSDEDEGKTDGNGNAPSLTHSPPPSQSIDWSIVEGTSIDSFVMHNLAKRMNELQNYLVQSPNFKKNPNLEELATTTGGRPFLELYENGVPEGFSSSDCVSTGDNDDQECRVSPSADLLSFHIDDPSQFAKIFLFCDEPEVPDEVSQPLFDDNFVGTGSIYFPQAGVYVTPKAHMAAVVTMWDKAESSGDGIWDGYTQDYHLCPNHSVLVHNVARSRSDA